jgi:hypothetical protein
MSVSVETMIMVSRITSTPRQYGLAYAATRLINALLTLGRSCSSSKRMKEDQPPP